LSQYILYYSSAGWLHLPESTDFIMYITFKRKYCNMSVLVLQIIIKQWDKSQRTTEHQKLRANIPDKYSLTFPPAVYVFDQHCVLDQHGDDIQGDRVKYFKDAEGKIKIDRFQLMLTTSLNMMGLNRSNFPYV